RIAKVNRETRITIRTAPRAGACAPAVASTSTISRTSRGKTLASAYSARASAYAGASAPLTWAEVEQGVDREAFTIRTLPERLASVGDLWAPLRAQRGVDLRDITG
ncbi:MAG: hypothetical protein QM736_20965, partial [Vicinamibacterales bacterium]